MTITVPSAINLKMKFAPAFDDTDAATIEFAIEEAAGEVGDTWVSRQQLAIMYLAAHLLTVSKNAAGATGGREVISKTIGRISWSYKQSSPDAAPGSILTTWYGARFDEIRNGNFPAVAVV